MIIDASNTIVGRLATKVAKAALLGEDVIVVNCQQAVIAGTPAQIKSRYKQRADRGTPAKGPFMQRRSHMFVKRIIRGMLPYKKDLGKQAYSRIKCYATVPETLQGQEMVTIKDAQVTKLTVVKYTTIKDVTSYLGGKI